MIQTYPSFEFSRRILNQAETIANPRLKIHIDQIYASASSHLAEAIAIATKSASSGEPASISNIRQTMTGGSKALRDGLAIIVKVLTILASGVELRGALDKEGVESVSRIISGVSHMLEQLSTSMFKILDAMDRILGKSGNAGAYAR